jgi:hypothetical protein
MLDRDFTETECRPPEQLSGLQPRLSYRAQAREWSLWWPCRRCGGAVVPLSLEAGCGELDALLASVDEHVRAQPCPGCLTQRNRSFAAGNEPAAWYDTLLEDWAVRVPCGSDQSFVIPLEIRWYDTPKPLVMTAAADVVFGVDHAPGPPDGETG